MKKIFFIAALIASAFGAFAQGKAPEIFMLLNNPANTAGSQTTPDTTRAATAYYFETPTAIHNVKSVIIQCNSKKDSGTVAGNAFIEGSIDPTTPGTAKTWFTLVAAAGDSLAIGNGDASRYWTYTSTTTVRPEFLYYRAHVNITAISRSRVKCWLKAKLETKPE